MNGRIIVVAGPTAAGKTEYAIKIARAFDGEIVSCDSMQLYKYMDIGSAKPTAQERAAAVHHLVDEIDPREEFSVVKYCSMAKSAIFDIISRGKVPVIAGGTGLYLNSLLYDMDFGVNEGDPDFRKEMEALAREKGSEYLHSMLAEKDPAAAERLHPNNVKRVIRALEACSKGGKISDFSGVSSRTKDYDAVLIGLTRDRANLYERINLRVDKLIQEGLVDEVRGLMDMGLTSDDISMKGIGYKEIIDHLNGKCSLKEAIDTVKKNTRHYAKRQMTWFRRYEDMKWFDLDEYDSEDQAAEEIIKWLRKRF